MDPRIYATKDIHIPISLLPRISMLNTGSRYPNKHGYPWLARLLQPWCYGYPWYEGYPCMVWIAKSMLPRISIYRYPCFLGYPCKIQGVDIQASMDIRTISVPISMQAWIFPWISMVEARISMDLSTDLRTREPNASLWSSIFYLQWLFLNEYLACRSCKGHSRTAFQVVERKL